MVSTMSMPSVSTFSKFSEERGRAMATIRAARATIRRMKGRCRLQAASRPFPVSHWAASETVRDGCRLRTHRHT